MTIFLIFLTILIIQRLLELYLARLNEKKARLRGAIEYDKKGYYVIVLFHVLFLLSLTTEKIFFSGDPNTLWPVFLLFFLLAQLLRYWSIAALGEAWNTKVLVIHGNRRVNTGPYKFIKHPNYLTVSIELAAIPLMFSCFFTAFVFTCVNFLILARRIQIEEMAIKENLIDDIPERIR